ncbi:MAG: hypothetical protein PUD93_12985 [Lachnospiraceae bacterium]|nr:hypothetical protein [Lachnospiraceae bacterium]
MQYKDMFSIVEDLPFDKEFEVFSSNTERVYLLRPSVLPRKFSSYDPKTNIQIWLEEPGKKAFKPNHLRILIDLKLRMREHPELRKEFLEVFDKIFYGEDPLVVIKPLLSYKYTQHIGSLESTAILAQLFLIEQVYGFNGRTNYNPPSLYIQGWIRYFIDSDAEIDILCRRICSLTPPPVKYTCRDDKNHKNYSNDTKPLWYL